MKSASPNTNVMIVIGVAVLALAIGFALARMTGGDKPAAAEVPKTTAAANPDDDQVKLPQAYIDAANIDVEPITTAAVGANITAPGSIVAVPGGEALVVARAAGNITAVLKQIGDTVKEGDVLARVSSGDGARIAAERQVAQANVELARRNQARDAALLKQGVLARQEAESSEAALISAQAEAQRANIAAQAANVSGDGTVAVVSPIAGTISTAQATLGAFVEPQAVMYRVTGSRGVEVQASVRAGDTARIQAGDPATILRSNGQPLAGTVRAVTPAVGGLTRAATVVVTPAPGDHGLVIGDGVQVRLVASRTNVAGLSVPEAAVQNLDGNDVLFVRNKDGFRAQPVRVGVRSGGMAEIISGVKAGEQVATRNAFLLKAEMKKSGGDEE